MHVVACILSRDNHEALLELTLLARDLPRAVKCQNHGARGNAWLNFLKTSGVPSRPELRGNGWWFVQGGGKGGLPEGPAAMCGASPRPCHACTHARARPRGRSVWMRAGGAYDLEPRPPVRGDVSTGTASGEEVLSSPHPRPCLATAGAAGLCSQPPRSLLDPDILERVTRLSAGEIADMIESCAALRMRMAVLLASSTESSAERAPREEYEHLASGASYNALESVHRW